MPDASRLPWRVVALSTVLSLGAAVGTYNLLSDDDGGGGGTDPSGASVQLTPESDAPTADEVAFTTFDDEVVPLDELRGTPVVVNFFSKDCVPCVTEMPAFEEVHQEAGDQVTFLGLAVADRGEDAEAFVESTGVTYRTARDPDATVIGALGGTVLPTTVLLDADGAIVAQHTGALDADELRTLLADELGVTL